jgi:hypothetical protein
VGSSGVKKPPGDIAALLPHQNVGDPSAILDLGCVAHSNLLLACLDPHLQPFHLLQMLVGADDDLAIPNSFAAALGLEWCEIATLEAF